MRVLIEEYRGWKIYFNTESEGFYVMSNEFDTGQNKPSFASAKKYVDDYIKENTKFKPIEVQRFGSIFNEDSKITLIGMRKDGAFMYDNGKGGKNKLSVYDEGNYYLVDKRNDDTLAKIKELNKEAEEIKSKIKELDKSLFKKDVKQIRKDILGS